MVKNILGGNVQGKVDFVCIKIHDGTVIKEGLESYIDEFRSQGIRVGS